MHQHRQRAHHPLIRQHWHRHLNTMLTSDPIVELDHVNKTKMPIDRPILSWRNVRVPPQRTREWTSNDSQRVPLQYRSNLPRRPQITDRSIVVRSGQSRLVRGRAEPGHHWRMLAYPSSALPPHLLRRLQRKSKLSEDRRRTG